MRRKKKGGGEKKNKNRNSSKNGEKLGAYEMCQRNYKGEQPQLGDK